MIPVLVLDDHCVQFSQIYEVIYEVKAVASSWDPNEAQINIAEVISTPSSSEHLAYPLAGLFSPKMVALSRKRESLDPTLPHSQIGM